MNALRAWFGILTLQGCVALAFGPVPAMAASRNSQSCQKISLVGEVGAGAEFRAALGGGWIFRVVPVQPGNSEYSGWNLVVDREPGAGFPDALALATPPWNSINEKEIATTFGLRAQDALGWNPRSFRFLNSPAAFSEAQDLYRRLSARAGLQLAAANARASEPVAVWSRRLVALTGQSSPGQFQILDARMTPGVADAPPWAQAWASRSSRTPHQVEPANAPSPSPLGELHWMRFAATLWAPASWKPAPGLHAVPSQCPQ